MWSAWGRGDSARGGRPALAQQGQRPRGSAQDSKHSREMRRLSPSGRNTQPHPVGADRENAQRSWARVAEMRRRPSRATHAQRHQPLLDEACSSGPAGGLAGARVAGASRAATARPGCASRNRSTGGPRRSGTPGARCPTAARLNSRSRTCRGRHHCPRRRAVVLNHFRRDKHGDAGARSLPAERARLSGELWTVHPSRKGPLPQARALRSLAAKQKKLSSNESQRLG